MHIFPKESPIINPISKWKLELKDEIENPYSHALKRFTQYDKNSFFITNIFLNIVYLMLVPFVFVLEIGHSIKEPHPFSWKLTALSAAEMTFYTTLVVAVMYGSGKAISSPLLEALNRLN